PMPATRTRAAREAVETAGLPERLDRRTPRHLPRARRRCNDPAEGIAFYENTLRLTRVDENRGWVQYRSGSSDVIIYEPEDAGSNKATTAAWTVNDVRETVRELRSNGVNS